MRFEPRVPVDDENVNVTPVHPVKEALTLTAGILAVSVVGFLLVGFLVEQVVVRLPPEVESSTFGALLSDLEDRADEQVADERLLAARDVMHRLLSHAPASSYRHRVELLAMRDTNAFALPGGAIMLTRGFLDSVESENELAFVLGHELGHFHHRDHLRRLGRGMVLGLGLAMLTGAAVNAPGLPEFVEQIGGRTLDRSREYAADAFGLELLHATYGHVNGATHFFDRLPKSGFDSAASWVSTHPAGADRIERLRQIARENGWSTDGDLTPLP